jgi:predicted TIM-barrel fold metal-dependent hydrolase
MSDPVRIDSHVHIYQSADEGIAAKEGYEIWEYGRQDEVAICDVPGTVDDLLQSMEKSSMDKVVIVNLYVADEQRAILRKALPPNLGQSERERAERDIEARVREELLAFNRWACDVARDRPSIFPFVCADVLLFTGEENAAHVRDLAENQGARGVKLHGPAEGFFMGDERLWPTYTVCRELGPSRHRAFGPGSGRERLCGAESLRRRPEGVSRASHRARTHGRRDVAAGAGDRRELRQCVLRLLRGHRMDP